MLFPAANSQGAEPRRSFPHRVQGTQAPQTALPRIARSSFLRVRPPARLATAIL